MKEAGEYYFVIDLKSIYEQKDAEQLKNKLPPSVIKSSGTPLILHKDRFLQFIGQRKGFLKESSVNRGIKVVSFYKGYFHKET